MDSDGEIMGTWRYLGVPGLWYGMGTFDSSVNFCRHAVLITLKGNLALCRFYSKHMAMRMSFPSWFIFFVKWTAYPWNVEIKAMEEGVFGERYSIPAPSQ